MGDRSLHITTMVEHVSGQEAVRPSAVSQSQATPVREVGGFSHWGDTVSRLLLLGFSALLPFFTIPVPWMTQAQSKLILASLFLISASFFWATARFSEGVIRIPSTPFILVVGLLPLAYFISAGVSGWNVSSIVGSGVEQDTLIATVIWYAIFLLITLICTDHRVVIVRSLLAFAGGLFILFSFQIAYAIFPSWLSFGGVLQGETANLFGSWRDLGIIAGLGLFLSGTLWVGIVSQRAGRWALAILSVLALFILVIVHFRDVFWGTSVLLLVGGLSVLRYSRSIHSDSWFAASGRASAWFIGAVLFCVAGFYNASVNNVLPSWLQIDQIEVRPSWQGTLDVARQSIDAPREFLFGAGPNSFIREWGLHKPQEVNLTPFWNTDFNSGVGVIPTSIFAVGAIGLLAWTSIIFLILFNFLRLVRENQPLVRMHALFGITLVAASYLVAYHMVYTPSVAMSGVTFLFLAFLAVCSVGDRPTHSLPVGVKSVRSVLTAIGTLLLCFLVVFSSGLALREIISNTFVNRAAHFFNTSRDLAGATSMMEKALVISPRNDRAHRAAAELGVAQLATLIQSGANDDSARIALKETLEHTIEHGLTAVRLGDTYQNWLSLAQIYGEFAGANVDGAYENASDAYARAFEAQPTNPIPKVRLAQIAIARNEADSARTYLHEAIALKPDLAIAYYLLSQVEAASGNGDPAVEAAAEVVRLVPNDALGWFNLGYILYSGRAYQEGVRVLEQSVSLSPDYANALFVLGLSYNQIGRSEDAARAFERVAQLNPSEQWLSRLIENVRVGKDPFDGINETQ